MPPNTSIRSVDDRDALVLSNTGLVGHVVRQMRGLIHHCKMSFEDAHSAGMLGLLHAAELYNPADPRKAKFCTYASWAIRRSVMRACDTLIHVPRLAPAKQTPEIMQLAGNARRTISLFALVGKADLPLLAFEPDREEPDGSTEVSDEMRRVNWALKRLSFRDEKILRLYYLDGLSLSQVGELVGRTKERVRQIKLLALRRLRAILEPEKECVK